MELMRWYNDSRETRPGNEVIQFDGGATVMFDVPGRAGNWDLPRMEFDGRYITYVDNAVVFEMGSNDRGRRTKQLRILMRGDLSSIG